MADILAGMYDKWNTFPSGPKKNLLAGAHINRQLDGGTAVPADQFDEQTHIKRGKGAGGMKDYQREPSKWLCGLTDSMCDPTSMSPWKICTVNLRTRKS